MHWTRKSISRSKLAYEVTKKLNRYLICMAGTPLDGVVDDSWRAGKGIMHTDNMFPANVVSYQGVMAARDMGTDP